MNLFAYCGNNPVNRIDPTGEAWIHWLAGAAIVAACAAATIITCGGFAAAATAVCMVGGGVAAATTASTVAAAAFIGSATVYATAVVTAASSSSSMDEFRDQGNWGTVLATATATGTGMMIGNNMHCSQSNQYHNAYNYSGNKSESYTQRRGWTDQLIRHTIHNGQQGITVNRAGEACMAYGYPGVSNQYVVINSSTRSLVQASNLYDSNWIVDSRIIWFP